MDLESMGPGFESRDPHDFFFHVFFFFFFFLVINTTVLICKFNITITNSTQFTYFITPYMMPRPPAPSAL